MSTPADIPFQQLLDALVDETTPFHPRFLYRLSDLDEADLARLEAVWPTVPAWRRKAVMEDVEQLGETNTIVSFEALSRYALKDESPGVRLLAVHALWEYDNPDLIPVLSRMAVEDPDQEVRAAAANGLGIYVYQGELEELDADTLRRIEDLLLQILDGKDSVYVRRRALESLGFSSREEVEAKIESAFQSKDREWQASALFAMGRSANERWAPQVLQMLDNLYPAIRMEAARAAGELELHEAVPTILELLEDPDEGVRSASIWSLSQIGGQGVREELELLFETAEEDEADYIEEALENLTFTEGVQLMPLFDISDEEGEASDEDLEDFEDLFDDLDDEDVAD